MFKKWFDFIGGLFTSWLFSTQGILVCSIVGGAVMGLLTAITNDLPYKPLSYGMVVLFGMGMVVLITRGLLSIILAVTNQLRTKKSTYLEYRVDNNHMEMVSLSNIYKSPIAVPAGQQNMIIQINAAPPAKKNRSHPQIPQPSPQNVQTPAAQDPGAAYDFTVLFEKPIALVRHAKIEKLAGNAPKLLACLPDERWCKFTLSEIKNGAYFRIVFNSD